MVRRTLTVGGVAVAATGVAVSTGIAVLGPATGEPAAASLVDGNGDGSASTLAVPSVRSRAAGVVDLGDRTRTRAVSRSADREPARREKPKEPRHHSHGARDGHTARHTAKPTSGDPRDIARALLPRFGFDAGQFSCLDAIYSQESGWDVHADNPSSSAYGIPQALPGSKMASAGRDWADDATTQIRWGLGYIKSRYGTPCNAWGFKQSNGWY